jgi:acyl carrier protein
MELKMEISSRQEKSNILSQFIYKDNPHLSNIILTEDTVLQSIDLDSLDIIELQIMYEEYSNTVLTEPRSAIITIRDLINLIE